MNTGTGSGLEHLHTDSIFSPIFIPASEKKSHHNIIDSFHSHHRGEEHHNYLLPVPPPIPPHNTNSNGNSNGSGGHRKVFVGGLSWETDEKSLRDYFSRYGVVSDCVIMRDRHTGHPRGFGFVTYEDEYVAERVASARHELDGRQVEAKRAVPRSECVPSSINSLSSSYPGNNYSILSSPPININSSISPASSNINNNKKVFVGGLPATCGTDQFVGYFRKFGPISDAQVMYDHHTGNSRGFGFVTFQSQATVDLVVDGCEHDIMGKFVDVKRAEPRQVLDARRRQKNNAANGNSNNNGNNCIQAAQSLPSSVNMNIKPVSITPSSVTANLGLNNNHHPSSGNNNMPHSHQHTHPNSNNIGIADDGFGIFESANPYSPQIAQTVHSNLFGAAAPPDIFSVFARPVASARVDRRYHPYASRERVSRSYW